ncbi:MAG: MarR family transcriptional regulator [Deltaproteobacteria bacterium]|nr:MarR family transcriptional regulator [Deltaproteobacteria bacterium]
MKENGLLEGIYLAHQWLSTLESTPRDYGTGDLLFSADIHTVVAISRKPGCSLTELATFLSISKAAVSKFVNKLERLGYVIKPIAPQGGRAVALQLTRKGISAVNAHSAFEKKVFGPLRQIEKSLSQSEYAAVARFLSLLQKAVTPE